jgi:hypothetical protein
MAVTNGNVLTNVGVTKLGTTDLVAVKTVIISLEATHTGNMVVNEIKADGGATYDNLYIAGTHTKDSLMTFGTAAGGAFILKIDTSDMSLSAARSYYFSPNGGGENQSIVDMVAEYDADSVYTAMFMTDTSQSGVLTDESGMYI